MLDQQQGAARGAGDSRGSPLYRRTMPGGGYVEVELELPRAASSEGSDRMLHGRIIMERRADPSRRFGHQAPVVAELTGDDRDELMGELFRLARDNAALARSLMQLRSAGHHAD